MKPYNRAKLDNATFEFIRADVRESQSDVMVIMYGPIDAKQAEILNRLGIEEPTPGEQTFLATLTTEAISALSRMMAVMGILNADAVTTSEDT